MHILIIISISLFFFCGVLQSFSRTGRLEDLFSKKALWFFPQTVAIGLVESAAYGLCAIFFYCFCPYTKGSALLMILGVFVVSSGVWLAGYYVAKGARLILSILQILLFFRIY